MTAPRTVDVDGLRWAVRVAGSGPALLLLHGFTGSGRSWEAGLATAAVDAGFTTIAPDLPGHGGTAWHADGSATPSGQQSRATIERIADDLPGLLRALGHDRAHVVGYSMGARVALRLAIAHPASVARLVLEAPSAGIADAAERAARRAADDALARTLERDGIERFVDAWERTPVLAGEARLGAAARATAREIRLGHDPSGLAASLRAAGQGAMEPLHGRLGEIAAPTLVIVGADDPARDRAEAVAAGIPGARLAVIDGVGHAPHLEAPARVRSPRPRLRLGGSRPMTTPVTWTSAGEYRDIRYEHSGTGIAKVTIDRPEVRNAFRPETVAEMIDAFARIRDDGRIGCVLLTGAGDLAFCAGGDQNYKSPAGGYVGGDGLARLNVLDLQRQIRSLPIPVIALVNGFAIGGGQVLHVVCDLTIASENAVFGQVGPLVGSFDAGFGIGLLARLVGDKKAKEIWFLCRRYSADEALAMGLVNAVVPLADLEAEGVGWATEILAMSPTAIRFLKSAFLVATDGLAGLQEFAGNATGLYYTTDEAHEGSRAFLDKRAPDYSKYPRRP